MKITDSDPDPGAQIYVHMYVRTDPDPGAQIYVCHDGSGSRGSNICMSGRIRIRNTDWRVWTTDLLQRWWSKCQLQFYISWKKIVSFRKIVRINFVYNLMYPTQI